MAVKIKLKRIGKTRNAQYRIVIADSRTARSGRSIEEIGIYQPRQDPSVIRVDSDRAQYWLGVGAQPTEAVQAILTVTGDWQKFKGLPAPSEPLKVAPPKPSRTAAYEAEAKAAAGLAEAEKAEKEKEKEKAKREPAKKAGKKAAPAAAAEGEAPAEAASAGEPEVSDAGTDAQG